MQTRDRAHRLSELFLAHEWNRVHRDALAADVVPVRLRDGALGHHAHLRAAADDDHAFAIDALERRDTSDLGNALEAGQVRDQLCLVACSSHLQLQLREVVAMRSTRDVGDVRTVIEDRLRDPVEDSRLVARGDQ